jgi:ribosome maturation factor RimP
MERIRGVLTAADTTTITIQLEAGDREIPIDTIDQARTVFDWSPAPKPGKGSKPGRAKKEAVS